VAACTVGGRTELPPVDGVRYLAAVDQAYKQDTFVLGIAHREGDHVILDRLKHWTPRRSKDTRLDVLLDEAFEILYPVEDLENWEKSRQAQIQSVRQLAAEWSERNPPQVAERIVSIEREAEMAGVSCPRWTFGLCSFIAEDVSSPAE